MATQITNQATLNYTSGTATRSVSSNTASVTMQGPLEASKYALENGYQIGDTLTYNVFLTNTSPTALSNVKISDNLGTSTLVSINNITPLTLINPAKAFVDQVYSEDIDGVVTTTGDSVTFTVTTLAAGSTLMLQYKAKVNEYADATLGTSVIKNIVTITADGMNEPITVDHTIPIASYADVVIEKSMAPDPVVDGGNLTYTFHIRNYGTIAATNVTLHDAFKPDPTITHVSVDGVPAAATDYTHTAGNFTYPNPAAEPPVNYTIPAATFTRDSITGIVSIEPGISTFIVQGTI